MRGTHGHTHTHRHTHITNFGGRLHKRPFGQLDYTLIALTGAMGTGGPEGWQLIRETITDTPENLWFLPVDCKLTYQFLNLPNASKCVNLYQFATWNKRPLFGLFWSLIQITEGPQRSKKSQKSPKSPKMDHFLVHLNFRNQVWNSTFCGPQKIGISDRQNSVKSPKDTGA